jgi:tRNA(Ile)-lysidine synthase
MAAIDTSIAAVRRALRRNLSRSIDGRLLVACSGGADSLALAAATAFVAPRLGWRAGLTTVDHQLQAGSTERAAAVADWAAKEGFDPVVVRTVRVDRRRGGPEAAARSARYEALVATAHEYGASRVLLGHTMEDQAETVLLALVRGSGPRGLAGMPVERVMDGVVLSRPLLTVTRSQARSACAAFGLSPWDDPHNNDPAYRRTHARRLLAALVDSLGPAVVANLGRTARLAAADAELLDTMAADALASILGQASPSADSGLPAVEVARLPAALRGRVLHAWASSLGCPPGGLGQVHIDALDALVVDWRGQGPVGLPSGIIVARRGGRLVRSASAVRHAAKPGADDGVE